MASFEEALINSFQTYPVLYYMSMKDYKNEKMKANIWEKIAEEMRMMGYNVSGIFTYRTAKIFATVYSHIMYKKHIDVLLFPFAS